jgi:hypothetical protein
VDRPRALHWATSRVLVLTVFWLAAEQGAESPCQGAGDGPRLGGAEGGGQDRAGAAFDRPEEHGAQRPLQRTARRTEEPQGNRHSDDPPEVPDEPAQRDPGPQAHGQSLAASSTHVVVA